MQAQDPFRDGSASVTVGVSMGRAKVWSAGSTDLSGFRRWCQEVGRLGRTPSGDKLEAPRLGLRIPQTLREFPLDPLAVQVDTRSLVGGATFELGGRRVLLAELELVPKRLSSTALEVKGLAGSALALHATIGIEGKLTTLADDPGLPCHLDGAYASIPLHEALELHSSLTVYYADASSSNGNRLYTPPNAHLSFPTELLIKARLV